MPPVRTVPPARAAKTERTHEENQERAYIAASRRSDRSLEARVESARRASEIHKRRTGRSLRVTEQDVVNEEMYEEEDDDLPYHYRRLTAGFQTNSADFNRKLAAYLTNHVAMRSALDEAITCSYAQTYPNAPQFVHNHSMYQSPFMAQMTQTMAPPMPYNPAMYRQFQPPPPLPYPMPGATTFMHHHHPPPIVTNTPQQAAINTLQDVTSPPPLESRSVRAISMPVAPLTPSPSTSTSTSNVHTPQTRLTPQQTSTDLNIEYNQQMTMHHQHQIMQSHPAMDSLGLDTSGLDPSYEDYTSPYTMSLPPETQMFLGNTLDPNDPLTSMMMAGSMNFPSQYPYGSYYPNAKPQHTTSFDGLMGTLAPSSLDVTPFDNYTTSLNPALSQNFNFNGAPGTPFKAPVTSDGGAPATEKEWSTFVDNDWDQNSA